MFSDDLFSGSAFSEHDSIALDNSAFSEFLRRITVPRCWLLEVDALSLASAAAASGAFSDAGFSEIGFDEDSAGVVGGAQTLYYSSHGWRRLDTGNERFYPGRIRGDIVLDRGIVGRDGIGGLSRVFAEISLSNGDGALDALLSDYSIDGRPVRILVGPVDGAYDDFGLVFSGVVQSGSATQTDLRLRLSDGLAKLDRPLQSTRYTGAGGNEGGADLKGKPKPLCFGRVFNVAPPLVDAVGLVYQVHDGAISDVPALRDRGVALVKVSGVPAAGQYSVNAASGLVTLGASPAGAITCDVLGDASGSGYTELVGSIGLRILSRMLTTSEINTTSFAALSESQPAPVGIWIGAEETTAAEVIDELLGGVGAFGGFTRAGLFTVGVVSSPEGVAPVADFDDKEIFSVERQPLPAALDPVCWRVSVGYQKNYTPQTDLAALATETDRAFAAEAYRVAAAENSSIASRHLLARDYGPVPGLFALEADAELEADRLFALWGTKRAQLRVQVPLEGMLADLGSVVTLTHARQGLAAGRSARVVGQSIRGTRAELVVIV